MLQNVPLSLGIVDISSSLTDAKGRITKAIADSHSSLFPQSYSEELHSMTEEDAVAALAECVSTKDSSRAIKLLHDMRYCDYYVSCACSVAV